ncbi:hypothetical protein [Streptomyces roseolus]|uniref:hypothetical protein n=1 Tax=Streptomyces roseolus TaxID=67358 RepID=UPI0037A3F3E9
MTTPTPATTYMFLVPGLITLYVTATTEATIRSELEQEGATTIELPTPHPTTGRLTITALDLTQAAAKLHQTDNTLTDDALPAPGFHLSDITRVAARALNDNWTTPAGAHAATDYLENKTRATGLYIFSAAQNTLQLQYQLSDTPCTEYDGNDLPSLAKVVANAVLNDLPHTTTPTPTTPASATRLLLHITHDDQNTAPATTTD